MLGLSLSAFRHFERRVGPDLLLDHLQVSSVSIKVGENLATMCFKQGDTVGDGGLTLANQPGEFDHSLDRHSSVSEADQNLDPLEIALSVTPVAARGPGDDNQSQAFVVSQRMGSQTGV